MLAAADVVHGDAGGRRSPTGFSATGIATATFRSDVGATPAMGTSSRRDNVYKKLGPALSALSEESQGVLAKTGSGCFLRTHRGAGALQSRQGRRVQYKAANARRNARSGSNVLRMRRLRLPVTLLTCPQCGKVYARPTCRGRRPIACSDKCRRAADKAYFAAWYAQHRDAVLKRLRANRRASKAPPAGVQLELSP
jgi:hypothetical protein